ncbi:MAG: UDP-N-acetylmuramoyl-tripeptide--D-alanyl-D-alanine ligase [Eubacteriales bacterium]|nr:UDP-N-acetylmuramoyl-tripeptide--D-alanyl-D-alanine ligase [Eubacteriales bacterium]
MKMITAAQAARLAGGVVVGDGTVQIIGVSTDSRSIPAGSLFIPIRGERFDGHDFLEKAVEMQAAAVMSEKDVTLPVPVIRVDDTRRALLALSGGYRLLFDIPVVGITGSVGKTTTKEMTAAVLAQKYHTMYTQGNLNNEIGMPLTLFRIEEDTQAAVVEMGMSNFQEISRMTAQAKPNVAIITNVGTAHIEFLGSREGIRDAKLEILEGLQQGGTAVLNGDEPLLWCKKNRLQVNTLYFGIENPACDVRAEHIVLEGDHVRLTIVHPKGSFDAVIGTAGRHNVYNALAAATAGLCLGLSHEQIAAGLKGFQDIHQTITQENGYTIIDSCYNASPDAVEASLELLKGMEITGKRFAVLGGMRELGTFAAAEHQRCGRKIAACADYLYCYGDGAEDYRLGAVEAGMPDRCIHIMHSHEGIAGALKRAAKPGDALLFKGSRYWKMEKALELFREK